jgi:hypothetical protein
MITVSQTMLIELIKGWRESQAYHGRQDVEYIKDYSDGMACAYRRCADELENALDLAELQEARDTADGTITLDELDHEIGQG